MSGNLFNKEQNYCDQIHYDSIFRFHITTTHFNKRISAHCESRFTLSDKIFAHNKYKFKQLKSVTRP